MSFDATAFNGAQTWRPVTTLTAKGDDATAPATGNNTAAGWVRPAPCCLLGSNREARRRVRGYADTTYEERLALQLKRNVAKRAAAKNE